MESLFVRKKAISGFQAEYDKRQSESF
jgi:hypothetical protein